MLLQITRTS